MTLRKRIVDIPLTSGVRTDVDRRVAPKGFIDKLENLKFDRASRLVKREGFEVLGDTATSVFGTSFSDYDVSPQSGETRRLDSSDTTNQLVRYDDSQVYSYKFDTLDEWTRVGDYPWATLSSNRVVASDGNSSVLSYATVSSDELYAVVYCVDDSTASAFGTNIIPALHIEVYEYTTGALVSKHTYGDAGDVLSVRADVDQSSSKLFFTYLTDESGTRKIRGTTFDIGTMDFDYTDVLMIADNYNYAWDAMVLQGSGNIYIAHQSSANGFTLERFDSTLASSATTGTSVNTVGKVLYSLALGAYENIWVAGSWDVPSGTVEHKAFYWRQDLLATASTFTNFGATERIYSAAIARVDANNVTIFATSQVQAQAGSDLAKVSIYDFQDTATPTLSSSDELAHGAALASRPFYVGTQLYAWLTTVPFNDTFQSSVVLCSVQHADPVGLNTVERPIPVCLSSVNQATGPGDVSCPPPGNVPFVYEVKEQSFGSGAQSGQKYLGSFLHQYAGTEFGERVVATVADFNDPLRPIVSSSAQDRNCIASGFVCSNTGSNVVETGLLDSPEFSLSSSVSTGALTNSGTYVYAVVFEFVDSMGNVHKSGHLTKTITLGASDNTVTVTIEDPAVLYGSRRRGAAHTKFQQVYAHVYRSTNGQTVMFRLTGGTGQAQPLVDNVDLTFPSYTYTDEAADSAIDSNDIIYTAGGALQNVVPPASKYCVYHNNRLWLAPGEFGETVHFSKKIVETEAEAFNDILFLRIEDGGTITGLASMDDNLVVFKSDRVFFVVGDGPDDLGSGQFPEFRKVTTETGCIDARSIIETSKGIFFQGRRGIYLLPRGAASPQYIGAPVEDQMDLYPTVTSAVVDPDNTHVRFTLVDTSQSPQTGATIKYDYTNSTWLVDTFDSDRGHISACRWNNENCLAISNDTQVRYQNTGHGVLDTGVVSGSDYIVSTVETSDLRLTGINGFKRVRAVLINVESAGQIRLKVSVAYDGSDTFSDDADFAEAGVSAGEPVTFMYPVKRQKCSAIRIKITDSSGSPETDGFIINSISLEVAAKVGTVKVPASFRSV